MAEDRFDGQVVLVTGGANGIGAALCRELARRGAQLVVADVDEPAGEVADPAHSERAVAYAVERFGGLDVVHLNAGVTTGCGVGDDFDLARYRRAMSINLDGVVFGVHAAIPALRARGGGRIVATASLAGLVAVPGEPIYAANKHAVVGLVRSLGPALEPDGIRINALCPGFADTTIVDEIRPVLAEMGVPIIPVPEVVTAAMALLGSQGTGECWCVQAGRASEPFHFRGVPGPRPAGD
jgi:NAD(P)-dependent dehydrogenase (short-subunit alcohol dehydrogenase family)